MRQGPACASIVVVASLCPLVSVKGSQPTVDVPFELVQQHLIVVKGSVAGLRGLNLLIDTGTIPSMLDQRIAGKLRLHTQPSQLVAFGQAVRMTSTSVSGLQIGVFQPGEVPAGIGDLSYLQGGRIDAIVGLDVLARTSFSIDYQSRMLSFSPSQRQAAVVPLQIVWPFLTVRLLVAGHPMQLLIRAVGIWCCSSAGWRRNHYTLAQSSVGGGEVATIRTPFNHALLLNVSPDGSRLLVRDYTNTSEGPLWVIPSLGGAPLRLGAIVAHDGAWSPDANA